MAALWVRAPDSNPAAKPGSSRSILATRIEAARPVNADDECQEYRLQPIALQRLHELGADRIADSEQEKEKQEGFGHARDRHMRELPDE